MNTKTIDAAPPSSLVPLDAYPLFLSEREKLINAAQGEEMVFCGDQALEGLPSYVEINEDTGCLNQIDISQMTYEMGYLTPLEVIIYFNLLIKR